MDDEIQKVLDEFDRCRQADRDQRELAVEDAVFINSDSQWSEDAVEKRKDRPRYTIDRISGALDQIIGTQRQIRTGIKTIPGTDGQEKIAEVYTGLIRSVEKLSKAQNAYDNAFDEALTGGYGGWRILTDYESDNTFDQVIRLKPIRSAATSLYFDPEAEEYDKRDAQRAFLATKIPLKKFQETWPNRIPADLPVDSYTAQQRDWIGSEGVRIAEYWYKKPVTRKLGLLSDRRVIDLEEEADVLDELALAGITVEQTREIESYQVEMRVISGMGFLTDPQPWAGKYIPLVPLYGRVAYVNGRIYVRGKVRKAKDPQRIYNYATSAAIEATALTPKDPIWITPSQAAGHETALRNFPTQNSPFMLYNPDPLAPGAPTRGGAPQLQQALLQQVTQASTDIHATTGLEPASLGNVPELKSGRAIEAQQAMGDRGSFIYEDNLAKSKEYTGEILVDLIPRVYDTERVVKIMGPDESLIDVQINQPVFDQQTGKEVLVNDLSQGSYHVEVTIGPTYASKRMETVTQLTQLASNSPVIQDRAMDLIIDNMDLNKKDEIKRRLRKYMIDQGFVEPTAEEIEEYGLDQETPPSPMDQAIIDNLKAQNEKLMVQVEQVISEIRNKDADTQAKIIKAQKDSVAALTNMIGAFIKKMEAGLPISPDDVDTIQGQQALVQETQEDVLLGQEIAGSPPLPMKNLPPPPVMPENYY